MIAIFRYPKQYEHLNYLLNAFYFPYSKNRKFIKLKVTTMELQGFNFILKNKYMRQNTCIYLILATLICGCTDKKKNSIDMIRPALYNWGEISMKDTIRAQVFYINLTNKTVTIDYVDTPCGCITAIPREFVVGKGDSTIIDIDFAPLDYGYTEKNLFVYFKEKKEPIHFIIKGKIRK